jgi:hypothetical protein
MRLKASYETESYISKGGYYAIKQVDPMQEEQIVLLSPTQLRKLAEDIQEALGDETWWNEGE